MKSRNAKKRESFNFLFSIFIVFAICLLYNFFTNNTEAAYISTDIENIDETKYPGYKAKIKQLQSIYPNIQVLYTGIDWDTAIYYEHSETHGRNLVSTSMDDAWVCQQCKNAGETYDSGLYCASEQAIEYMMDPRNFLNQTDIFQFQKLDTAVGTTADEISKVLNMEHVNYLKDDPNVIQAFANVAKNNNLNAYFLIARVIQEQGRAPTSPLATGAGYTGNGYTDYGKGYYNLFSINATGSGYMTRVNALTRAMEEGWDSLAKSIEGGGNFVGETYIDVGQNTLYLQKFSVYNTNGQLYWHQYMQNLFGAQSEANILKGLYQITGIQNSKDFVFIVPIYENMPSNPCLYPSENYYGSINTELSSIQIIQGGNGKKYISGYIDIAEWVNGECRTPIGTPSLTLKSTDGSFSKRIYISEKPDGIRYYFDTVIEDVAINKEYYIEAYLTGKNNLSSTEAKTQTVRISTQILGDAKYGTLKVENNILYFNYNAELETKLKEIEITNNNGKRYIKGRVDISEKVQDKNYGLIKDQVTIKLKSVDGTFEKNMFFYLESDSIFYFDTAINDLAQDKEYYIEIEDINDKNLSTNESKKKKLEIQNQILGEYKGLHVEINDNMLLVTNKYEGTVETKLEGLYLRDNGSGRHYICGNVEINELLKTGDIAELSNLPTLTLEGTDGYSQEIYVNDSGNGSYYFDTYIEDIDKIQDYYIEVKLEEENNIAPDSNKKENLEIAEQELGEMNGIRVYIENSKIIFEKYKGTIKTTLGGLYLKDNGSGRHYICGDVIIEERVNGQGEKPESLPKLTLVGEDGYNQEMYVNDSGNGSYYFGYR